ncbi:hypothetical protein [Actinoallomurus bryophytorum]|uniref:hypothetical protein n=1 Tax=Actinoallomurus bryophytorum TaxID=1490222 RepID=UPI00163A1B46|nr:hypothetical protein [Actinoallomurus bryophytorum]
MVPDITGRVAASPRWRPLASSGNGPIDTNDFGRAQSLIAKVSSTRREACPGV